MTWGRLSLALAVSAGMLAGCGGSSEPAAPGTPENPLVAKAQETAGDRVGEPAGGASGSGNADASRYGSLVAEQDSGPREEFTPCNLVTPRQAKAIIGSPIEQPFEAPQGPTCIYRTKNGERQVALAVQSLDLRSVKRSMQTTREVSVEKVRGVCGFHGQPMLYLALGGGRVLSVASTAAAPGQDGCETARDFARRALPRL